MQFVETAGGMSCTTKDKDICWFKQRVGLIRSSRFSLSFRFSYRSVYKMLRLRIKVLTTRRVELRSSTLRVEPLLTQTSMMTVPTGALRQGFKHIKAAKLCENVRC